MKYFVIITTMMLLLSVEMVLAADGNLDNSFDLDGKLVEAWAGSGSHARDSVVQPDGRIIVVGESINSGTNRHCFSVARFNPDGTLDNSFSGDGRQFVFFSPPWGGYNTSFASYATAVALQSDGKIVVAGRLYEDPPEGSSESVMKYGVARLNTDGTLDTSFGSGGIIYGADYEKDGIDKAYAQDVAIQSDGKIVIGGGSTAYDGSRWSFLVARFDSTGALDSSFGTNGYVKVGGYDSLQGEALSFGQYGAILIAGSFTPHDGGTSDIAMIRLSSDGYVDNSFGDNGLVRTSVKTNSNDWAYAVTVDHVNRILVAGYGYIGSDNDFVIVRYNNDGSLDTTFNADGIATLDMSQMLEDDIAKSIVVQPDGKILVSGEAQDDFALARLDDTGSLDSSFGAGGRVFTDFQAGGFDSTAAITLQPDGKIVAVGVSENNFAIARYENDGNTLYPRVVSVVRTDDNPNSNNSVSFRVTFSKTVSGVDIGTPGDPNDSGDFVLAHLGVNNPSITSITPSSGSSTTFTVTVNTGTGDGTLKLYVADDDSITDSGGNHLGGLGLNNGIYWFGETYIIDRTPPVVTSILRGSSNPTSESRVNFTVTFSESVSGVDATDFTLGVTGRNGAHIRTVGGFGYTFNVNVDTGTGSSGTIKLNLTDDNSIRDTVGYLLGGAVMHDGDYTLGETYTITSKTKFFVMPAKNGKVVVFGL